MHVMRKYNAKLQKVAAFLAIEALVGLLPFLLSDQYLNWPMGLVQN